MGNFQLCALNINLWRVHHRISPAISSATLYQPGKRQCYQWIADPAIIIPGGWFISVSQSIRTGSSHFEVSLSILRRQKCNCKEKFWFVSMRAKDYGTETIHKEKQLHKSPLFLSFWCNRNFVKTLSISQQIFSYGHTIVSLIGNAQNWTREI